MFRLVCCMCGSCGWCRPKCIKQLLGNLQRGVWLRQTGRAGCLLETGRWDGRFTGNQTMAAGCTRQGIGMLYSTPHQEQKVVMGGGVSMKKIRGRHYMLCLPCGNSGWCLSGVGKVWRGFQVETSADAYQAGNTRCGFEFRRSHCTNTRCGVALSVTSNCWGTYSSAEWMRYRRRVLL